MQRKARFGGVKQKRTTRKAQSVESVGGFAAARSAGPVESDEEAADLPD
jgi:hypothetical protein